MDHVAYDRATVDRRVAPSLRSEGNYSTWSDMRRMAAVHRIFFCPTDTDRIWVDHGGGVDGEGAGA